MNFARCSDTNTSSVTNSEPAPHAPDDDLYPKRRGQNNTSLFSKYVLGEGREQINRIRCEKSVYRCLNSSPLVKLMLNALKSSGCPVDIRRHISCEVCDVKASGGYDKDLNQIIICQNYTKSEGIIQGVLTHELIHMFDYCKNEVDFQNADHLACTEVRAANLAHCSFLSAWFQGDASPFRIKQAHQNCVKTKAAHSIMAVRKVDEITARGLVDRVFDKCYADLEPIGRRIKRNSNDIPRAYDEAFLYGYGDAT